MDNDTYVFEAVDTPIDVTLQAGETVPIEELPYCQKVVDTEQSLVVKDVEADAPELVSGWGIVWYLGTPVFVDDEVYGTFCFYGTEARAEAFTEWDFTFVEFLSNWVGAELEQRKQGRASDAHSMERPVAVD